MSEDSLKQSSDSEKTVPFFPDHVGLEFKVVIGVILLLAAIGISGQFLPVGVGEPADPLDTPDHVKPEWYFLALYQVLKYVPKNVGAVLPVILVMVLLVWPFFDSKQETTRRPQRVRLIAVILGLILLAVLTVLGAVT